MQIIHSETCSFCLKKIPFDIARLFLQLRPSCYFQVWNGTMEPEKESEDGDFLGKVFSLLHRLSTT
jgi:hypothetical protein